MRAVIFSVIALFGSIALLVSGNALLGTLFSLRLNILGVNETALGLVLACYSVGFVLGATFGTGIIRTVGHIRSFAVYAALACAAALLYPVVDNLPAWGLLRLVTGYCLAGLMTVTDSWINDRATSENRGKLLGVYTINFYIASSIGQVLVGWTDPEYFVAYSIVAILVVLSLVPLSLTRGLVPAAPAPSQALKIRRLAKDAPSGITGAIVSGFAISAFIGLAPVYAISSGLTLAEISTFMGFSIFCAILLQWPAGWLSDHYGRLTVLIGLLLLAALAALLAVLFGYLWRMLMFLFSGLFFAFTASVYPISVALTNDQLPKEQLVAACSAMLRLYGLGSIAGPALTGLVMQLFGAPSLFVVMAVLLSLAAGAIQFWFRVGDRVALADQGDYVTLSPVSSPVLTEIDPRNEDFEQHHPGDPADWDIADRMEMLIPEQVPDSQEPADSPSFNT